LDHLLSKDDYPRPAERSAGSDHDHISHIGEPARSASKGRFTVLAEPKIKTPLGRKVQRGFAFSLPDYPPALL